MPGSVQILQSSSGVAAQAAATQIVETVHSQTETNHALFGGLSGLIVSTVLHPLEVIKIGIIINPMKMAALENANFARTFYLVAQHIKRTEGVMGFFRGLAPELVRSCVGTSIYFSVLKELEMMFRELNMQTSDQLQQFTASALARMSSAFLTNPLGVVASRCQVPGFDVYSNMVDGFAKIYKYEGIRSFWKGALASTLKEGPFAGTYYVLYKLMKRTMEQLERSPHYLFNSMISGMSAGLVATAVSHPFEIIRARMQIISRFDKNSNYEYNGIIDAFRKIYANEGAAGYFKGLAPRLVRKPLANSLTFTFFELFQNFSSSNRE